MADVTIKDADEFRKDVPVDDRGRVSVGKYLAGEHVTIAVKRADSKESEETE